MEEIFESKCGICVAHTLHDVYSFISDLQHRGRNGCGIAAIGSRIDVMKWAGAVKNTDLEDLHKIFPAELYHTYFAHVRYATRGREDRILEDCHPHTIGGRIIHNGNHIIIRDCDKAIIHNGQAELEGIALNFEDKEICDTKILLEEYQKSGEHGLIKKVPGSYTLAIADKKRKEVIVMRDRYGIKPGCLGLKDGKYCVASENVAFRDNGARFIEDLLPGTIYYLSDIGSVRKDTQLAPKLRHCFFEWNYISHLESVINETSVRKVRLELGRSLAEEFHPQDIDVITYLPRCPIEAARSYAKAIGREHQFTDVFYKLNSERAFQGADGEDRTGSISKNLHLLPRMEDLLKDKTILVIDDSTIRGTNSKHAKLLLDRCSVKKIYYANYTPKIGIIGKDKIPRGCLFGVDMPPEDNFIVRSEDGKRNRTDEEIKTAMNLDVYFLSKQGMLNAFAKSGINPKNLCTFCIGGDYPFDL
jgi:amidophosphoribosyltransferase